MKVAVFGLGYVGAVTVGCLARLGHDVIGVDVDGRKVDLLKKGLPVIAEPGLAELLSEGVREGRIRATVDAREAMEGREVVLVSVGTPSRHDGAPDTRQVVRVAEQIGDAMAVAAQGVVITLRSTVPPGTTRDIMAPILEAHSGGKDGIHFHACFNPEFLREGSAVDDFYNPARTVLGVTSGEAARTLRKLYEGIPGSVYEVTPETAELVKYFDNAWHAVKVAFANEMGALARSLGGETEDVVKIFLEDNKLNISTYYLRPGTPFGGSCLPKDMRAVVSFAAREGVDVPLLRSVLPSNEEHTRRMVELFLRTDARSALLIGLSFKRGTDDLRESPLLRLAETLVGKGIRTRIYEPMLSLEKVHGANAAFLMERLPHIAGLLVDDPIATLKEVECVIVGKRDPVVREVAAKVEKGQVVIDLIGVQELRESRGRYHGLCW